MAQAIFPRAGVITFCLLASIFAPAFAADYYVAPGGSDTAAGTLAAPWKTIQHAADVLAPGDTVYVRAGTYAEAVTVKVSGAVAGGPVTFANYPGESPVIDAASLTVPSGETALFLIQDRQYVTVRGFELRNYKTTTLARIPAGVFVSGACRNIEIRNCRIHDIWNTAGNSSNSGNAFGLVVYGTTTTPITGVIVDGNELYNLKTGASECLSINGNVTGFQVTNNRVHDNNNIGIDFIGFEGTCPDASQDQARDGICRGNTVWNITSEGNQAYTAGDYSAGAIYCDGAARVTIENNVAYASDIGIELASEHAGTFTTGCILRNNLVYGNRQTGLFLGGYASSGTGGTSACVITGNTFFNNDTLQHDNGEVQLRYRTKDCTFSGNIFFAGPGGALVTIPVSAANNNGNIFDYNLYYASSGTGAWRWNNAAKAGLAAWRTASSQDAHSLFADPKFVSPLTTTGAVPDLHIALDSPAVDAGDPAYSAGSTSDIDGGPRVTGSRVDLGADELAPLSAWLVEKFGASAGDEAIAGPLATPAGDGIPNLTKYALGLPPREPAASGLLSTAESVIADGQSYAAVRFTRSTTASDVTLTVQTSGDLVTWQDGHSYGAAAASGTGTVEASKTTNGSLETLVVRSAQPSGAASPRFLRLKADRS